MRNVPDPPSYAAAAARGTSDDWSNSDPGVQERTAQPEDTTRRNAPRQNGGQFRLLSDLEHDNFHPLNVTPDRPCTAYFKAPEQATCEPDDSSFFLCKYFVGSSLAALRLEWRSLRDNLSPSGA